MKNRPLAVTVLGIIALIAGVLVLLEALLFFGVGLLGLLLVSLLVLAGVAYWKLSKPEMGPYGAIALAGVASASSSVAESVARAPRSVSNRSTLALSASARPPTARMVTRSP